MKMSKLQKFVLIFFIVIAVLVGGAFTAISIAAYKPTIAFYNVSEKVQDSLKKEINSMPTKKSQKKASKKSSKSVNSNRSEIYNFITLDDTIPLSKQKKALKKAKIVFATLDFDVMDFAKTNPKVKPQSTKLLDGTPSTTKQTALTERNNLFAVPLLYDFYEFDVNRPAFNDSNVNSIEIWDDLENFWEDTLSENSPFSFAGGDDATLIDFVGCVVESLSGTNALEDVEKAIYDAAKKENQNYTENTISELCEDGKPLHQAIEKISSLYKSRFLNQSFQDFQQKDTLFFMENHLINTGFLKLSAHRNIDSKVVNEFSSIYIPGKNTTSPRTFSSPTIVGIALSKDEAISETLALLATSRQSNISYSTGLAPIQANCSTPDKQADDVRFWLAASSGPNMPLSAAIPSAEMRHVVAEKFRAMIRF